MNLKREQEFVSQYHFDARNFEWENENGAPGNQGRRELSVAPT